MCLTFSYRLDGPLPDLGETNASKSTLKQFTEIAQKENLTILELAMRVAGARGKSVVRGSPNTITDFMEEWFVEEGVDGFNTLLPYLPGVLNNLKNEPFHRFVNLFRTLKHYHMPAIRNYIDVYIGDRLPQFNPTF